MRVFRKITMRLSPTPASFRVCIQTLKIVLFGTFPGAPAVQTLHAHCRRHEFNPQSRNKDTVQHTQIFLFPMKCQGIIITKKKKKKRKQEKKESFFVLKRAFREPAERPRLEQSGTHFVKYILYCSYPHYARGATGLTAWWPSVQGTEELLFSGGQNDSEKIIWSPQPIS